MSPPARISRSPGALRRLLARMMLRGCLGLMLVAPAALPSVLAAGAAAAQGIVAVPPGNRHAVQPSIPFASARRTAASKSSYDAKFDRVIRVLRRDDGLIRNIKSVSALYGIAPIHMLGAIVGEHTYNYDSLDSAQSYYVKALTYAGVSLSFAFAGEHVDDFVQRPQFDDCRKGRQDSNQLWSCYERIWQHNFRGKRVDGKAYPNKTFNETFFQPLFSGQSFGLGQLSPLTVLKMSDRVARTSGFPKLSARDESAVYKATMDPNKSLHYMAAVIRDAIDAYRSVAKVDISQNPGITATLYNLGNAWDRAARYRRERAAGTVTWPSENYYGWLVNNRLDTLESLL